MDLIIAATVGLTAGAHTATWGMFKDSPHEGFTWRRYSRSIWLAAILALIVQAVARLDLATAGGLVVLFGVTYVCERACVEFYKTFIREEDQSKYSIPMQFAIKGRVVHGRGKRWLAGALAVAAALFLGANVYMLRRVSTPLPETGLLIMVGSIGGWFSAFGGAWKDAPIEGFELAKFFRSPVVAAGYAFLLSHFTSSFFLIPLGALGFTIATLETYKTFFFPSKPRGKFADKPVLFPEMLRRRNSFVPLYVGIWLVVIVTFVVALR
ncbi:MAG: hypothetical protein ACREM1_03005 [Longimicrobiales bacterium]